MSEERTYFPLTWNEGFKKVFCTQGNEAIALQLLNSVIDDRTIVSIERMESHHQTTVDSYSVFDFYCKTDRDERIIVEMQNAGGKVVFMNRALAYSAMAILDQAKKGWNYEYKKVYFVGLLNYVHFHNRTQPFTKVMLQTTDDHIVTNYNYLQIFVELPKLAELIDDSTPDNEAFLCALRDIGKEDERPTRYARKSLDNLFSLSRYQKLKEEEKAKLEEIMTTEADYAEYLKDSVEYAMGKGYKEGEAMGFERGIEKGIEQGIEQGIEKANLDIARKMQAAGIDNATIESCTGICL